MACPPALVVDLVVNLEEVPSVDLAINTHEDVASADQLPGAFVRRQTAHTPSESSIPASSRAGGAERPHPWVP
jgi:hypothetical protein